MNYIEDAGIDFNDNREELQDSVGLAAVRLLKTADTCDGLKKEYITRLSGALSEFKKLIPLCSKNIPNLDFVFSTVAYLYVYNNYTDNKKLLIKAVKGNISACKAMAELTKDTELCNEWNEWAIANGYKMCKNSVADENKTINETVESQNTQPKSYPESDKELIAALNNSTDVSNKMLEAVETMTRTMQHENESPQLIVNNSDGEDDSSKEENLNTGSHRLRKWFIAIILFALIDCLYTRNFMIKQFGNDGIQSYAIKELTSKKVDAKARSKNISVEVNSSVTGIIQYSNEKLTCSFSAADDSDIPIRVVSSGAADKVKWWITDSSGAVIKNGIGTGKVYDVFMAPNADKYKIHFTGGRGSEVTVDIGTNMTRTQKIFYYINKPIFVLYQKAL